MKPVSFTPAWERYVDGLRNEESWIELMAMCSGLGKTFVQRFDEVLRLFKEHVQSVAHESHIVLRGGDTTMIQRNSFFAQFFFNFLELLKKE